MQVVKRDGRTVDFDRNKIKNAITKAFIEVDGEISEENLQKINAIASSIENKNKTLSVEEIQDIIESKLMASNRKDVAKAYIRFRYKKEMVREAQTNLDYEILGIKNGTSEETINNANKNGKLLQTLKPMIADVTIIDQAKRFFIPQNILKHHEKEIYIHDMNYMGLPFYNCCLINWEDCLKNGMVIGNAPIETPNSITVAVNLLSQIVAHVSSNCYGGVTLINLVKGLCPYAKGSLNTWREIAKENNVPNIEEFSWKMLEREIQKSLKGLEYEILTLTNSRGEIPFCTFELDAIDLNATDEEQHIQHLIITKFLQVRIDGLTGGVTPVFPKLCFELKRGNNLEIGDPYYDVFKMAVKCSSLRLYPDYLMHDKLVEVTGGYKAPMSCRSFIPELYDDNGNRVVGGGFNLGVCSINLPRLAIIANHDEEKFYKLLDEYLEMAKDMLLIRRNLLVNIKAKQAPILYQYGAIARLDPEETIEKLLFKNRSTVSIGYVGVHNALKALYGESFDTNSDMLAKGIMMVQYMKDYCQRVKDKTNIGLSLYSTPAETLATKFCRSDVKEFGIIPGINDKGYYENSFHYPSNEDVIAFDKIDLEANMSKLATGGAIQYTEFGNMINNPEALEKIIRYAYDKCHYFGVNVSSDRCFKCGYVGEMDSVDSKTNHYCCPQCGNDDNTQMSVIRRLCGYLGSLSERPTVDGKMKEINHRVKHIKTGCGE